MSAAIRLAEDDSDRNITIYSKDLGGEYLSGGLKFLHATPVMREFVMEIMNMPAHVEKVNGAIAWERELHQHPEFFWNVPDLGRSIQRHYWKKTRGLMPRQPWILSKSTFENVCMNDPWRYRNEVKLVPQGGIGSLIRNMESRILQNRIHFEYQDIDSLFVQDVTRDSDFVVFTIPLKILGEAYGFKPKFEYKPLNITRFYITGGDWPLWMDYIYVPSDKYVFHRISFFRDDSHRLAMDVEVNGDTKDSFEPFDHEVLCQDVAKFINQFFPFMEYVFSEDHLIPVKGHLQNDPAKFEIPKNVFLLGRYAQWDSRVTFDKVLEGATKISEQINEWA